MIKAYFFDWMGTLGAVKSVGSIGGCLTKEQKEKLFITKNFEDADVPKDKREIIKSFLDEAVLSLYNDSEGVIKELKKKGVALAIISNMYPITVEKVRDQFKDFLENFDVVNLSAEVGLKKPDIKIFENTLNKINEKLNIDIKPDEIIVIGNNLINDIETPKKLGMQPRLIDRTKQNLRDVI